VAAPGRQRQGTVGGQRGPLDRHGDAQVDARVVDEVQRPLAVGGRRRGGEDAGPGCVDPDGRTTVLLAPGTAVLGDPSYDVDDGPDDTVRVTGGPGPVSLRFG
jgi:hypothetical protein